MDRYACRSLLMLLLFLGLLPGMLYAQHELGSPFINNYNTGDYNAHKQNWAIVEDNSGVMYFGNGTGLVSFDGQFWRSYHLPTNQITRSLAKDSLGTIYVGSRGVFGYFEPDSTGELRFVSLNDRLDEQYHDFSDIWDIVVAGPGEVYFRSYKYLFKYEGDALEVIESDFSISTIFYVDGTLYARLDGKGLCYLDSDDNFILLDGGERFRDVSLYFFIPDSEDTYLLGSYRQGLFSYDGTAFTPFETAVDDYLQKHSVYRGIHISDRLIALATIGGGIVIIDNEGNLHRVIDKQSGLQSNGIFELYLDSSGQLWAALDSGISSISVLDPVTKFSDSEGLPGIVGPVKRFEGDLYAGTNEGLYRLEAVREPLQTNIFRSVGLENARIMDMERFENSLLVATDDGAYSFDGNSMTKILGERVWDIHYDAPMQILLMAGTQKIWEVQNASEKWTFNVLNEELDNEIVEITTENGQIWLRNDIGTLYKLDGEKHGVKNSFRVFTDPSDQIFDLSLIGQTPYLGTLNGLYRYDGGQQAFEPDTFFSERKQDNQYQVFRIYQQDDQTIWFRSGRKIQKVVRSNGNWSIAGEPEFNRIGEGGSVETIYIEQGGPAWFGGTNGLYRYDPEANKEMKRPYNALIRKVLVRGDSLVFGGYRSEEHPVTPVLSYKENEMRFQFSAAAYESPGETEFQVRLEGFDTGWSNWTDEKQKDYTNIPEGRYTFHVRARDVYGRVSNTAGFDFTVLPPWYRTIWAYLGYLLVVGGLLYGGHRLRINRILREHHIRNRIASDLHDEISATLSSISYFAQAIRQSESGKNEQRFINLISESASDAKEKITDIIWSIDPENDDWINLLSKCRRFASDLLESKDIDYNLDIDTDIGRPLEVEMRQHLWLIFKEMVTNAARHSGATRVDVKFNYEEGGVRLMVQDNGSGFDRNTVDGGLGLNNISRRAESIGADLTLESDPEIGARWVMKVPL